MHVTQHATSNNANSDNTLTHLCVMQRREGSHCLNKINTHSHISISHTYTNTKELLWNRNITYAYSLTVLNDCLAKVSDVWYQKYWCGIVVTVVCGICSSWDLKSGDPEPKSRPNSRNKWPINIILLLPTNATPSPNCCVQWYAKYVRLSGTKRLSVPTKEI